MKLQDLTESSPRRIPGYTMMTVTADPDRWPTWVENGQWFQLCIGRQDGTGNVEITKMRVAAIPGYRVMEHVGLVKDNDSD